MYNIQKLTRAGGIWIYKTRAHCFTYSI